MSGWGSWRTYKPISLWTQTTASMWTFSVQTSVGRVFQGTSCPPIWPTPASIETTSASTATSQPPTVLFATTTGQSVSSTPCSAPTDARARAEFEQKLQEQREEKEREIAEVKRELREKDDQIRALEEKREQETKALRENSDRAMKALKEEKDKQMKEMQVEVESLRCQLQIKGLVQLQHVPYRCTPPVCFTMNNFNQLKTDSEQLTGPDLYTHEGGYKIYFTVWPNGVHKNGNMTVSLFTKPGEFGDQLKWPVEATFTLQLLSQHRDQDHITFTSSKYQWSRPTEPTCLTFYPNVTDGNLEWNRRKRTQYLKNDCLVFRLTKVELKK